MQRTWLALALFCVLAALAPSAVQGQDEPWALTRAIELTSRWPQGLTGFGEDKVTAVLYRPKREGSLPSAVIINSSGGVSGQTEHHYARALAGQGMAVLVIDSFSARDVKRTGDDQNRVAQAKSNADAFAGHAWLSAQPWVDRQRIIVLGMSRGGEAAYSAALEALRRRMQVTATFAAHVAIAMGSCNFPQRDVRTTGGPIFFMLAELDPVQRLGPCIEYIERMRKAGTAAIRVAVYPGVYHAYESTTGIAFAADDWASGDCGGRFDRDENFILYHRGTDRRLTTGSQTAELFRTCLKRGYSVGGDERVKAQATADLLQFLRDVDILADEEARVAVPDCAGLPDRPVRLNCVRARAGWTADLVALARAYRDGADTPKDAAVARRLFELAVARNHAEAMWELSIELRRSTGGAGDLPRALALARASAEAGNPAGMNVYGVMFRDGIGQPRDDAAARLWFQRAADLLNTYGMVNLGRFHWEGRGGLAQDRAAAVVLWRMAVLKGENPWAQVFLAEAMTTGEGAATDRVQARALLESAAEQTRDLAARARAEDVLKWLGPAATPDATEQASKN